MKKIMKKALSLALAVVMMLSLAPMTAKAAGSGIINDPIEVSESDTITTTGGGESNKVYYSYAAPVAGNYMITLISENENDSFGTYDVHPMMGYETNLSAFMGVLSINKTASVNGEELVFNVWDNEVQDLEVVIEFLGGPSGGQPGGQPEEDVLGSENNKDELVFDEFKNVELTSDLSFYYYKWTAEEDGYLTILMPADANAQGWAYSISEENWSFDSLYCDSTYSEEELVNPAVVGVKAGEVVNIWFATADFDAGTVCYQATFEPGEVIRQEEVIEYNDITKYDETYGWDVLLYKYYVKEAITGNQTVPVNQEMGVPTLYSFEPEEAGVYIIKASTGKLGYYGANTNVLTDPTAMTDEIEVTITSVGQSAIIGISDTEETEVTFTVTKKASVEVKPTITTYESVWFDGVSPEEYTFTGNPELLTYIDVEDDVIDKAVYNVSDGYYHYNTANGPILLVDLDGKYGSIDPMTSANNNALKAIDADGKGWDYSELYRFYAAIADKDTKLYPLNHDLVEIYQVAGKSQGWYMESFDGITTEDAWLFNCYFVPNAVEVEVPADNVVTEEALDAAIKEALDKELPLVVETTTEGVTLTFAVEDLKDAEAVKLNVEVKLNVDIKDETVAKNDKITADNFVLKIEFSHDGKLPAKATITIPVPVAFAGKTLYYYEILADGTLKFVCDAPVDANGVAKVTQDHCSDYVLLTEKIVDAADTTSPKTGDSTNIALWVAVLGLGVVAIAGSVVMKKREF